MNTLPTTEPPDDLDRLLSDFFKAQLKRPWPGAPFPSATAQSAEPSGLAAARAAEAPARRDTAARARVTLAASAALMFGVTLYLSDGFQPGERPGSGTPPHAPGMRMLPGGLNDGSTHPPLQKIEENKARGNGGDKIDVDKFE